MRKWFLFIFLLNAAGAFCQTDFHAKVKLLQRFLQQQHYQPITWNDSSSARLYKRWINGLDDEKLLFTQQDIDQLAVFKYQLDDEITGPAWQFFDKSLALYQKKIKQVDSVISQLLVKPFDLTKQEYLQWPFTSYAVNDQQLHGRWQQFLRWEILRQIAEKMADTNGLVPLKTIAGSAAETAARNKVKKRELSRLRMMLPEKDSLLKQMQDDYLNDIAWCYDPHTSYMNEAARSEFETEMSAAEYSVGMGIIKNDNGDIEINYLQPGGSAWRSGQLHKGDVIIKIKIENEEEDVTELSEDDVEDMLHSAKETAIAITVKTKAGETKLVTILKEKMDSEEAIVKSFVVRGKQNIGYIDLPGFYNREEEVDDADKLKNDGCANDVSKEIIKLKKDSIAGLILDLRFNGGGNMWEAVQLAGIFIDVGPVASTKERDGKIHFLKDPNRGTIYDGPLVVLVNGASASASEFLSAALQDYNRALIVGENTYGKGTAQSIIPMDTLEPAAGKKYTDFVKVTGKKFYRVKVTRFNGREYCRILQ